MKLAEIYDEALKEMPDYQPQAQAEQRSTDYDDLEDPEWSDAAQAKQADWVEEKA
jgi:hypothetical protein